jgi:hypothetical protein
MNIYEVIQSPAKSCEHLRTHANYFGHLRNTFAHLHTPSHTFTHLHTPSHTFTHLHTPSHTFTHLHTPLPTHAHLLSMRTALEPDGDLNRWPVRGTLHGRSLFTSFWQLIYFETHSRCFVTRFLVHGSTPCKEYLRVFSLVFPCKVRVVYCIYLSI